MKKKFWLTWADLKKFKQHTLYEYENEPLLLERSEFPTGFFNYVLRPVIASSLNAQFEILSSYYVPPRGQLRQEKKKKMISIEINEKNIKEFKPMQRNDLLLHMNDFWKSQTFLDIFSGTRII
jgi:hypothetical protein